MVILSTVVNVLVMHSGCHWLISMIRLYFFIFFLRVRVDVSTILRIFFFGKLPLGLYFHTI